MMTDTPNNPVDQLPGALPADAAQVDGVLVNLDGSLTVQETAAQLGISERTVRRRIKDGILTAYKLPTTQGYEWRVQVDGASDNLAGVSTRQSVKVDSTPVQVLGRVADLGDTPAIIAALELAEQLRKDNAALASRNEQLAGQLGFTQAKLQEAERTVALLMAPKDEPSDVTPRTEPEMPAVPDPKHRPWWKRLFG